MTAKNLTRRAVIAAPVAIAVVALGIFLLSGGGEDKLPPPAMRNPCRRRRVNTRKKRPLPAAAENRPALRKLSAKRSTVRVKHCPCPLLRKRSPRKRSPHLVGSLPSCSWMSMARCL